MEKQYERNCLNSYQLNAMQQLLNDMVAATTACERIRNTPMPLAYGIHLKQLLLIYCLLLPFQMVKDLGWSTAPVVGLVSFTLLGIEDIGLEIENPFGRDANDLPLDALCDAIRGYAEQSIAVPPNVRDWKTTPLDLHSTNLSA
ncbi:bestrophin family ion channel [Microseira sp. BLCC-F43]|jgi:putative membrane protein|uniref:bestrophin family ion channel n=1 Tax=Microseira sp. BLCC-F43 TaxID=3153602 RepID=UPI0035B6DB2F